MRRFGLIRVGIWQGNCSMEIIAVQQFSADSDIDLCTKILNAERL
jgi:hypothetical protein